MSIPAIYLIANPAYMRQITDLNQQVDDQRIVPAMVLAQDKHIQAYLGTKLYNKVLDYVSTGIAPDDYVTLIDTHVRRCTCWWTMVELLPMLNTRIDAMGIIQGENTVEPIEITKKVERARQNAHFYTERMISFLQYNSEKYPEYNSSVDDQMRAEPHVYYQSGLTISGRRYLYDTPLRYVAFPISHGQ